MQLRNYYTLGAVYYKCTGLGHIGDIAQKYILYYGVEVLMIQIGTRKAKLGLQGNTVGQSSLKTLFYRILRWIYEIVDELQFVAVARIFNGENFLKHPEQSLVLAIFGRGLHLEEIPEAFQLNFQQIGVFQNFRCSEVYALATSGFF